MLVRARLGDAVADCGSLFLPISFFRDARGYASSKTYAL
jgi:hypothetical protein